MELREEIAEIVHEAICRGGMYERGADEAADAILAIPDIRDALACLSGGSREWERKQGLRK